MSPDDALIWFKSLPQEHRARFLAALSFNLTIAARCFFDAFDPPRSDMVRARCINEILHRVTSYLQHILLGDENRNFAPIVTKGVLDQDDQVLAEQVSQAWEYAQQGINV